MPRLNKLQFYKDRITQLEGFLEARTKSLNERMTEICDLERDLEECERTNNSLEEQISFFKQAAGLDQDSSWSTVLHWIQKSKKKMEDIQFIMNPEEGVQLIKVCSGPCKQEVGCSCDCYCEHGEMFGFCNDCSPPCDVCGLKDCDDNHAEEEDPSDMWDEEAMHQWESDHPPHPDSF